MLLWKAHMPNIHLYVQHYMFDISNTRSLRSHASCLRRIAQGYMLSHEFYYKVSCSPSSASTIVALDTGLDDVP